MGIIKATTVPQKQREKAQKQEPPPSERFAAPEAQGLPPCEPSSGAPVPVPLPRESSPESERGSARLCTDSVGQMTTSGAAKSNGPTNGSLVGVEAVALTH